MTTAETAPRARGAALRLGRADDPAERAADAIADAVLAGETLAALPPPTADAAVRRACARCADEEDAIVRRRAASPAAAASPSLPPASLTATVADATAAGGSPLPASERAFFEPRLGRGLGDVRVHTGAAAARSAQALDALAYTAGHDVVFAAGQFASDSAGGRRLLAHELAHVVQGGSTLRRDQPKAAKPTKFYQEVLDEIAGIDASAAQQLKEKKYELLVYRPLNYKPLKALAELAQAVDEERTKDIPALNDAFITVDHGPPMRALDKGLYLELMARLFTLGLDAEAAKLRAKFSAGEKADSWIREDTGLANRDRQTHQAIVDRLIALADSSTPAKARATLVLMCKELALLRTAYESYRTKDAFTKWHEELRNAHFGIIAQLVRAIETQLQALTDLAAADLAEGKGSATLLVLRDVVENHFAPAIHASEKDTIGDLVLAQTTTEIGKKGKGTIKDAYDQGPKGRTVAVSTYDPTQDWVQELRAPLIRLPQVRREQIAVLARLYGASDALRADRPEEQERSADAAANAAALKNLAASGGKLRLENDGDWRAFLLQKLKDGGTDKAAALRAVMSLLYDYLQAFTVHARFTDLYDQADFTDSYFGKAFPRSLAGQLVHDCGVYAVRVAYLLSLVRSELGLRIRWIRLPAHVGLIIDGEGLPTFIAHNDHFREYDAKKLADLRAGWDAINAKARAPGAKPGKDEDDEQFIGELAAAEFISGPLDMPFIISDVPGPGKTDEATRQALWKDYQRVAKQDVFGAANSDAKSPNHLFHKRYLAITQRFRDWRNTHVRPFWNDKLPPLWAGLEKAITTDGEGTPRSDLSGADLAAALTTHLAGFDAARKPVDDGLAGVHADERSVGKDLRADPKLPARDARISQGSRFSWNYAWDGYRDDVAALKAAAEAAPTTRFTLTDVKDRLKPPFIPQPQNAMGVLD